MRDNLVTLTSTDGEMVYSVVVNVSNVAALKPITTSKVVKTKVVFSGGAELNVVESLEETQRKMKGDGGQVIPLRK